MCPEQVISYIYAVDCMVQPSALSTHVHYFAYLKICISAIPATQKCQSSQKFSLREFNFFKKLGCLPTCYTAKVNFELQVFLPPFPECWAHPIHETLGVNSGLLYMLSMCSTNRATSLPKTIILVFICSLLSGIALFNISLLIIILYNSFLLKHSQHRREPDALSR